MLRGSARGLLAGAAIAVVVSVAGAAAAQPAPPPAPPPAAQPPPPAGEATPPVPPPGFAPTPPPVGVGAPGAPPPPPPAAGAPVVVPDYPSYGPSTEAVPKRRANPTMMTWGVIMTTTGLLATITGSVITASSIRAIDIYCDGPAVCQHRDDTSKRTVGSIIMLGGAGIGAIGFPLWLFGGRMVPVRAEPAKPKAAFAPDVRVGAGHATVSFVF